MSRPRPGIANTVSVMTAPPSTTPNWRPTTVTTGSAVITETVFAIPGLGRLIVAAIGQLDFPVVQASVFLLAMIVVTVNFTVDLLYTWLNPVVRVR